eukprot:g6807.t1
MNTIQILRDLLDSLVLQTNAEKQMVELDSDPDYGPADLCRSNADHVSIVKTCRRFVGNIVACLTGHEKLLEKGVDNFECKSGESFVNFVLGDLRLNPLKKNLNPEGIKAVKDALAANKKKASEDDREQNDGHDNIDQDESDNEQDVGDQQEEDDQQFDDSDEGDQQEEDDQGEGDQQEEDDQDESDPQEDDDESGDSGGLEQRKRRRLLSALRRPQQEEDDQQFDDQDEGDQQFDDQDDSDQQEEDDQQFDDQDKGDQQEEDDQQFDDQDEADTDFLDSD